jgi:hypothetical protein
MIKERVFEKIIFNENDISVVLSINYVDKFFGIRPHNDKSLFEFPILTSKRESWRTIIKLMHNANEYARKALQLDKEKSESICEYCARTDCDKDSSSPKTSCLHFRYEPEKINTKICKTECDTKECVNRFLKAYNGKCIGFTLKNKGAEIASQRPKEEPDCDKCIHSYKDDELTLCSEHNQWKDEWCVSKYKENNVISLCSSCNSKNCKTWKHKDHITVEQCPNYKGNETVEKPTCESCNNAIPAQTKEMYLCIFSTSQLSVYQGDEICLKHYKRKNNKENNNVSLKKNGNETVGKEDYEIAKKRITDKNDEVILLEKMEKEMGIIFFCKLCDHSVYHYIYPDIGGYDCSYNYLYKSSECIKHYKRKNDEEK